VLGGTRAATSSRAQAAQTGVGPSALDELNSALGTLQFASSPEQVDFRSAVS
jgi:hypothetical protein